MTDMPSALHQLVGSETARYTVAAGHPRAGDILPSAREVGGPSGELRAARQHTDSEPDRYEDGVIAVFRDRSPWTGDPWQRAARTVVQEFPGERRRADDAFFSPVEPPYEEMLRASDCCDATSTTVPVHGRRITDQVIGCLHSTSFTAQHLFGDGRDAFEAALTETFSPFAEGGQLPENNAFTVFTVRRPSRRRER
ncbi:hypothetical protein ACFSL4_18640 [Streptomyces caeni]|uniref:SAM-dependent methyltransferase n=1 Tax=Streptomyces caeni TaxID=2307231 RepID=A0ABW4IW29_9ACTN